MTTQNNGMRYRLYAQKHHHSKEMELAAEICSFDLVKVLQGYYRSMFLNCRYEETKNGKS